MLFGEHRIDKTYDEYLLELEELASNPKTLVFFDTNIIAYLYKLHDAARQEFFSWSDVAISSRRLGIPAWSANEYLSRVTSGQLSSFTPRTKEPSQAKKALDSLHATASLCVDEGMLKKIAFGGDRTSYLNGFRAAIDELDQFTRVFSQQFDPGVIHQQIVDHLSTAILDSDTSALCEQAFEVGAARFAHRIPPGFKDERKDENCFGDLIIWFEILKKAFASAATFPRVLFVTNDEKKDWVYAPQQRIEIVGGGRKPIPNAPPAAIKLADPRLVAEFLRTAGGEQLVICSLPALVQALSKVKPLQFSQLAAAIQINLQEAVISEPNREEPSMVPPAGFEEESDSLPVPTEIEMPPALPQPNTDSVEESPGGSVANSSHYDREATLDYLYPADGPSEINSVIRALKSLNWYVQNPAITKIRGLRTQAFSPSSWFVLGRNIYQSACGNSQKAMEFMGELSEQMGQFIEETAQHLFAGMLYEIYFDSRGQFRQQAKFGYADKVLATSCESRYEPAVTFIRKQLNAYRGKIRFVPGDDDIVRIEIKSISSQPEAMPPSEQLMSVQLDGIELIQDDPIEMSAELRLILAPAFSEERLKALISFELAIPKWALRIGYDHRPDAEVRLELPVGKQIVPRAIFEAASPA